MHPWTRRHCQGSKGVNDARVIGHAPASLGKLSANPNEVLAGVEPAGFTHLPILGIHAAKVVELAAIHRDPFDRILVAQARLEPMILLTDDEMLRGYGDLVEVV